MFDKKYFLNKYQKSPVVEYQNNTCDNPLVTVTVITFQHEDYIGKCLDGILMQKTNFDFEILIGEDASTDRTRDICVEYARKYPNKIKLFLHSRENNILVYGAPTASFNSRFNLYSSKGKYIAICDGDDYWTDPLKLQKQVDFLEANEDFSMVFSDISMINSNGEEIKTTTSYSKVISRYKSGEVFWSLLNKNFINSLTTCVRKDIFLDYLYNFDEDFFDYRSWLHIASYGKLKYVNEKWAVYRIHDKGMSRSSGIGNKRRPLIRQSALLNYLSIINYNTNLINADVFSNVAYAIFKNKDLTKKEKEPIIALFKKHPKFLIYILRFMLKKIWFKIKFLDTKYKK